MPTQNNYKTIYSFGSTPNPLSTNPITYSVGESVDQNMLHGSSSATINGQYSKNSQIFMANYCANRWDGFCELASTDKTISYANNLDEFMGKSCMGMTQGDMLILNTARVKYLIDPGNQVLVKEPFDPNVANSPFIYYWKKDDGDMETSRRGVINYINKEPRYAVNPETIDGDIVMDKILTKPGLYSEILNNIYSTMERTGELDQLRGTKLGDFFF